MIKKEKPMKNEKVKQKQRITALSDGLELNCMESKLIEVADPYIMYIENNLKEKQKVILFGDAVFGYEKNFGSDEGVKIKTNGRSYGHLLKQSGYNPFKIAKWRFHSDKTVNFQQEMVCFGVDANGREVMNKLDLSVLRDAYQSQLDIIDVTYPKFINHNVYFQLTLEPRSEMIISVYPTKIYNILEEENAIHKTVPRLSGGTLNLNPAPVIIRPVQSVKSKDKTATKKVAVKKAVKKAATKQGATPINQWES